MIKELPAPTMVAVEPVIETTFVSELLKVTKSRDVARAMRLKAGAP